MSYVENRGMVWGGTLALLLTVGCASPNAYTRPSPEQISAAEDAVQKARARGAHQSPQAAPFMTAAERQLAAGRRSLNEGDNRNATWLLARAAADGDLSHAMVERQRLERDAQTAESQLNETRAQSAPPPPPPSETAPPPPPVTTPAQP
jgi:Domain of unknown function (DUF4398)